MMLQRLDEHYESGSPVRELAKVAVSAANPAAGVALTVIDAITAGALSRMAERRARTFFDELEAGRRDLTPEMVRSDPFLHRFFAALTYALRTESEEKIRLFARLLRESARRGLDDARITDEFEEFLEILNDLSRREIGLLVTLAELRATRIAPTSPRKSSHGKQETQEYRDAIDDYNARHSAFEEQYWADFNDLAARRYGVVEEELPGMLMRLARSGLYTLRIGTFGANLANHGDLTPRYDRLAEYVRLNADTIRVNQTP